MSIAAWGGRAETDQIAARRVHRRIQKVHLLNALSRCTAWIFVVRLRQTDESSVCVGPRAAPGRWLRRGLLAAALAAGAGWAAQATGAAETADALARAGAELARLLRFMAVLKAALASAALAAVWWRLALPAAARWTLAYGVAGAAAAAGPVLIWNLVHPGLGALLLHGGLFGALALLWRDPAVAAALGDAVAARRRALARR